MPEPLDRVLGRLLAAARLKPSQQVAFLAFAAFGFVCWMGYTDRGAVFGKMDRVEVKVEEVREQVGQLRTDAAVLTVRVQGLEKSVDDMRRTNEAVMRAKGVAVVEPAPEPRFVSSR